MGERETRSGETDMRAVTLKVGDRVRSRKRKGGERKRRRKKGYEKGRG